MTVAVTNCRPRRVPLRPRVAQGSGEMVEVLVVLVFVGVVDEEDEVVEVVVDELVVVVVDEVVEVSTADEDEVVVAGSITGVERVIGGSD